MFKWLKQREINKLLIERARYTEYLKISSPTGLLGSRWEVMMLAGVNERLRQLGYKEQDNG